MLHNLQDPVAASIYEKEGSIRENMSLSGPKVIDRHEGSENVLENNNVHQVVLLAD